MSDISWKYRGIEITIEKILPHCFWICPWHILLPWIFCWIASMKPWWACTALLSTIDFLPENLHFIVHITQELPYRPGFENGLVLIFFLIAGNVCIRISNRMLKIPILVCSILVDPARECLFKVHIFWEGHNIFEIFTLLLSYVLPVKCKVKILQNFVALSEYMNFKPPDAEKIS